MCFDKLWIHSENAVETCLVFFSVLLGLSIGWNAVCVCKNTQSLWDMSVHSMCWHREDTEFLHWVVVRSSN
jgi:hypothetical protein